MSARIPTAGAILRRLSLLDAVRRAAGGSRIYLVGGAVRNAILGLPILDLDFVVSQAPVVAARLAQALEAAVVPLHDEFPTVRVVVHVAGRNINLDFADPRAPSLRGDLQARDFTINAIAAGPLGQHPRLFDPCRGRKDLSARVVRMTSARALAEDPVRVVRAYRFAAELGFRIEAATRRQCRQLASRAARASAERLGAEILAMCAGRSYDAALQAMADDGVLGAVIPELAAAFGIQQLGVHQFDVGTHSLLTAIRLAGVIRRADELFPTHAHDIRKYLNEPGTRSGLVLAALLHDIGKPECREWSGGRWRFFGHEARGAAITTQLMKRLALPRHVRQQVQLLVRSHMRLIAYVRSDEPTDRAKRRLIRQTAPHYIGLLLLCLADCRALRCDEHFTDEQAMIRRMNTLLDIAREMTLVSEQTTPLITGNDLIRLGFQPGPLFGEILAAVEEEWVAGKLNTKAQALEWVKSRWPGELGTCRDLSAAEPRLSESATTEAKDRRDDGE